MVLGGNSDDDAIHPVDQLAMMGVDTATAALGYGHCLCSLVIDDADQIDVGEGGEDAGMFLAEMADANDGQANAIHAVISLPSCRLRLLTGCEAVRGNRIQAATAASGN